MWGKWKTLESNGIRSNLGLCEKGYARSTLSLEDPSDGSVLQACVTMQPSIRRGIIHRSGNHPNTSLPLKMYGNLPWKMEYLQAGESLAKLAPVFW